MRFLTHSLEIMLGLFEQFVAIMASEWTSHGAETLSA